MIRKPTHVDLTMLRIAYADKAECGEPCEHVAAFYLFRAVKAYRAI